MPDHNRKYALAVSEGMDVPDDRLYGIITYGGEDHLMVADEHNPWILGLTVAEDLVR